MTIDLKDITSKQHLHSIFKKDLNFPEWYGPSWDAFWDVILYQRPISIVFLNWDIYKERFPKDAEILISIAEDYNKELLQELIVIKP